MPPTVSPAGRAVNLLIRSNTSLAFCVGSRSKCLGRIDTQSFLGSPQVVGGEGLEYQAKSVPLSGDPWCDRRTFGKKRHPPRWTESDKSCCHKLRITRLCRIRNSRAVEYSSLLLVVASLSSVISFH